ncbi:N-ethylmaleimide reductase [Salinimicrobium sediminis]|uniref:N-ethylmaleimide reductase n=1 Tax=Salinimicrobium sediminis TaxID=1343891 RepID=A0A285X1K9_9FLAO|nr:alkene reductase [Salinimicrobium sediminis]SOC79205.1 N-ethylmaleimide reductase [Salinimicrobium sediminis]
MSKKQALLQAYNMNGLELPNRVVMAPMTRSRADNAGNKPTADLHGEYYKQRASAGLIIAEGSQISEKAVGYINTPGIYTEEQVKGWKEVTRKVHEANGRIFLQLWHVGRMSHPDFHDGELPLAPSAINPNDKSFTPEGFKETVTPKEMSIGEIKETIEDFKKAAENAMKAGFDGVEIHASNGYLLHQFFNGTSNTRSDEYGGSIEKRTRILFDVLDAIKEVVPENKIGIRLNPSLHDSFGMTLDEETIPGFDHIVQKLNDYNLAYLHLSEPFTDVSEVPYAETQIAKRYSPMYNGTIIINGGFDRESGNKVIEEGNAHLVAYGRPYISNPDLVERFEQNVPLSEFDQETFYSPGKEGYLTYEAKTTRTEVLQ